MALIMVRLSDVSAVRSRLEQISRKIDDCNDSVRRIKNNIDFEVGAKENIMGSLDRIAADLKRHSGDMSDYSTFVQTAIEEFVTADGGKYSTINSWLDNIKNRIEDAKFEFMDRYNSAKRKWEYLADLAFEQVKEANEIFNKYGTPKKKTNIFEDAWNGLKSFGKKVVEKGKEFGKNVVQAGKDCVSWIKESYDSNGVIYKLWEGGKAALKVGSGILKVGGSIISIFGTGGCSIPLAAMSIVSGINDMYNGMSDVANLCTEQYDKVGETNILRDTIKEGAADIGEMLGNREAGETVGDFIYLGYEATTFLISADKMLDSFGKVNTVVTGTTGYSPIWGQTTFSDIMDAKHKLSFDWQYAAKQILGIDASSAVNVVWDAVDNVVKMVGKASDLGESMSEFVVN